MTELVLASGSPRRIEMMSRITEEFEVAVPDIDETPFENENPENMVIRLAGEKVKRIFEQKQGKHPVLAADTVVVLDNKLLSKPVDEEDAEHMLKSLSGRKHQVITGVAIMKPGSDRIFSFIEKTDVYFSKLEEKEIKDYIKSKEPMDKAGAYGIQGDGGRFIKKIDGCFYNVMGFPLNHIYCELKQLDII